MPVKNRIKPYVENGYYHIYNRGVEKRVVFQDDQDYSVFLSYLKEYLLPKDEKVLQDQLANPAIDHIQRAVVLKKLRLNNFNNTINLLAYCLMLNHFHFLIHQASAHTINYFMRSLCTRYSMYFNKKNKRVGPLFQSAYKAVLVETDPQLLHLSRYIHRQALASKGDSFQSKPPSSYPNYLGKIMSQEWIKPNKVLAFFKSGASSRRTGANSYQSFVEEYDEGTKEIIGKLILEE